MPIDLAIYTRSALSFIKTKGMACVYVASFSDGKPSKIGYTSTVISHMAAIRAHHHQPISVYHLLWAPSRTIAQRVELMVSDTIRADAMLNGWFDVPVERAAAAVASEAKRLYPTIHFPDHAELLQVCEGEPARKKSA